MDSPYDIQSSPKGHVLIINNEIFDRGNFPQRQGSKKDYEQLKLLFEKLGFKIMSYNNLKAHDFAKAIKSFAGMEEHWKSDCCILFIMTHGFRDTVNPHAVALAAVDGKFISTDWIKEQFNSEFCKSLMNKPKVMFFEACRGTGPKNMEVKRPKLLLSDGIPPHISDMVCVYSCLPGFEAYTIKKKGSLFVRMWCTVVKHHRHTMHLNSILNKVDIKLREQFSEKNHAPYQAIYTENWSFNKLMFLSSRALDMYKVAKKHLELKGRERQSEKPQATRPLLVTKGELRKALNGMSIKLPICHYGDAQSRIGKIPRAGRA